MCADNTTYRIVRMYHSSLAPRRTIKHGLTLAEAHKHCEDPETSSSTCKRPANVRRTRRAAWGHGSTGSRKTAREGAGTASRNG